MSHYATLDVDAKASVDEIKKAFRKKASAAHPDKGGSKELMQAVNQAYEVLSDPDRRAKYDATGESSQEVTIEQKAIQLLTQLFTMALDEDGNIITIVRDALKGAQDQANVDLKKAERRNKRLITRRDKIAVKSGENLVHLLIDAQVDRGTRKIASIKEAIEITKVALQMLDDYTSTEEARVVPQEESMVKMLEEMIMRKSTPFGQGGPQTRRPFHFGADFGKEA